jgi:P pilus assembly chaperone PapD
MEQEMITKRFVLATSMMVLLAMSGQAYAGVTISDTRYWPSEASSADQNAVQRPENAFSSAETPRAIKTSGPAYQGGPKGNE